MSIKNLIGPGDIKYPESDFRILLTDGNKSGISLRSKFYPLVPDTLCNLKPVIIDSLSNGNRYLPDTNLVNWF